MNKYIVKNCPACCEYTQSYCCEDNYDEQGRDTYCELINDCLIKQVIKKCHNELGRVRTIGKDIMAKEILQLFDIEECE